MLAPLAVQATEISNTDALLEECLQTARTDPTTAIAAAGGWLGEAVGSGVAAPQTCLGVAYTRLSRWEAATEAFSAAREATPITDPKERARLGMMAGNAALVVPAPARAANLLQVARADAMEAGEVKMAGEAAVDLARALVALERVDDAEAALGNARVDAPQFALGWLLSATLARRMDKLSDAQAFIETAIALDPDNPEVGLEAGVIAALAGRTEAARSSFSSVVAVAPDSDAAQQAQAYLDQLDE